MPPSLPPEIIGKIISKTRLQYNKRRFDNCGFDKNTVGYAEMMLKQEEVLWDGTVQWIKSVLEMLRTTIRRIDGHPNRWNADGGVSGNVPDKLLGCWPRYWHNEDDDVPPANFVLNQTVCEQIATDCDYCFQAGTNDRSMELVLFRDQGLHPALKGLQMKVVERYTRHDEDFSAPVDTLVRSLEIYVFFLDKDVYRIDIDMETSTYPDQFDMYMSREKDGRSYTERRGDVKERHRNQDHLMMFIKRLVTMEPAPYLQWHPKKFRKEFREQGFYKYGCSCW
jgi:hypothetical protein